MFQRLRLSEFCPKKLSAKWLNQEMEEMEAQNPKEEKKEESDDFSNYEGSDMEEKIKIQI